MTEKLRQRDQINTNSNTVWYSPHCEAFPQKTILVIHNLCPNCTPWFNPFVIPIRWKYLQDYKQCTEIGFNSFITFKQRLLKDYRFHAKRQKTSFTLFIIWSKLIFPSKTHGSNIVAAATAIKALAEFFSQTLQIYICNLHWKWLFWNLGLKLTNSRGTQGNVDWSLVLYVLYVF